MLLRLPDELAQYMMSFLNFWNLKNLRGVCKGIVIEWKMWERAFGTSMSCYIDCKISPFLVDLAGINTVAKLIGFEKRLKMEWPEMEQRRSWTLKVFFHILNDDVMAFQDCIYHCPHVLNNFESRPKPYNFILNSEYYYYMFANRVKHGFDERPFFETCDNFGIYLAHNLLPPFYLQQHKSCPYHIPRRFLRTSEPWGEHIDMRDLVIISTNHQGSWTAPHKIKALASDEFWKAERVTLRLARKKRAE